MKIRLPEKQNIAETTAADPLKFYYVPLCRSFYLARFADAVRFLGNRVRNLLDVGCGSGIFLAELSSHCEHLYANDFHPNLANTAEMLCKENVQSMLLRSDARHLPYKTGSMDAIVCMSVLEHLTDLDLAADEFDRVLKPGGVAIIGIPIKNVLTEAIFSMSYLTLDARLEDEHVSTHRDVLSAFSKKFVTDRIAHIPRMLPEFLRLYTTVRFRKEI